MPHLRSGCVTQQGSFISRRSWKPQTIVTRRALPTLRWIPCRRCGRDCARRRSAKAPLCECGNSVSLSLYQPNARIANPDLNPGVVANREHIPTTVDRLLVAFAFYIFASGDMSVFIEEIKSIIYRGLCTATFRGLWAEGEAKARRPGLSQFLASFGS